MSDASFHRDPRNLIIIALSMVVVSLGTALAVRNTPSPPPPPLDEAKSFAAPAVDPALLPVIDAKGGRSVGKSPYELNQVRNTITKNTASIRSCYLQFTETKPAVTDGKVLVDWQIKGDGSVSTADIVSSDIQSDSLHQCLTTSIKAWRFPPPPTDRPVYTSFTFVFKDDKNQEAETAAAAAPAASSSDSAKVP